MSSLQIYFISIILYLFIVNYVKRSMILPNRSADSAIKGFFYQFEKTLEQLLSGNDSDIITIEGIEDVDNFSNGMQQFIQCKYHQQQENYTYSIIEKPILLMLQDWCSRNREDAVNYILFCYFPNKNEEIISLSSSEIKLFINKNTPKHLLKYKNDIREIISRDGEEIVDDFVNRLKIHFGPKLETLKNTNIELLKERGFEEAIIETVIYPSAMAIVHELSIKHQINERKICISDFWDRLRNIDSTILHKYTKLLKNYDNILQAKRKYFKKNLKANTRTRCFVLDENSFDDYENTCVNFIKEFLDNYQKKMTKLHINGYIPTFVVYATIKEFENIFEKLLNKGITANCGFTMNPDNWKKEKFFATPMVSIKDKQIEFNIRLLYLNEENESEMKMHISNYSPDDLYIINTNKFSDIEISGNKELLNVNNVKELKYLLNMVGDYE